MCCPVSAVGWKSQVPLLALSSQFWSEKTPLHGPRLGYLPALPKLYSLYLGLSGLQATHSDLTLHGILTGCHCSPFSCRGMSTPL